MGGGCINTTVRLSDQQQSWFVKLNHASLLPMFEAEAAGLRALAEVNAVKVPHVLCSGICDGQAYLVIDYLELGRPSANSQRLAGQQLAQLHRATVAQFGWHMDNFIGATPQPNQPHTDWTTFWQRQRLGFQLELAASRGHGGQLQAMGERLLADMPELLGHRPQASLIHGDLWGGNMSYDQEGLPVIFDPAPYYADREAEIAMTELFGGFSADFYAAYKESWPLDSGYGTRKTLYNLYHILNHLNLFGGGYLGQAHNMMRRLLAEL